MSLAAIVLGWCALSFALAPVLGRAIAGNRTGTAHVVTRRRLASRGLASRGLASRALPMSLRRGER
ncbi:MAG: hypothetical protein AB7O97_20745 [Planctomycetota bacterium]